MMRSLLKTIAILWVLSVTNGAFATNTFVVVNAPPGSSIDQASLEALLTGQRRNWDDGDAAKVILPSRMSPNFDFVGHKRIGSALLQTENTAQRHVNSPYHLLLDLHR